MIKNIKIVGKTIFGSMYFIGFMTDPEFIIPAKDDIICISEEQVRIWNGKYTNRSLKVLNIHYDYGQTQEGEKICNIIIYVKPIKD